jgi:hypothetical protein
MVFWDRIIQLGETKMVENETINQSTDAPNPTVAPIIAVDTSPIIPELDGPNWEDIMWKSMLAQFGYSVFLDLGTFIAGGVASPVAEHWYFSPYAWMILLVAVCKSASILVFGGIAKVYSRYADKRAKAKQIK